MLSTRKRKIQNEVHSGSSSTHGVSGKEIDLLVNFFSIRFRGGSLELYQYSVQLTDTFENKKKEKVTAPVINPDVCAEAFWRTVESNRELFGDAVTYNDSHRCWTRKSMGEFTKDMGTRTVNGRFVERRLVIRPCNEYRSVHLFVVNPTSENGHIAKASCRALHSIFTQHSRYKPSREDRLEKNFVNKWMNLEMATVAVPSRRWKAPSIQVFPGVRAWLGLLTRLKAVENGDLTMNISLVHKMFYETDMNLVTFFCELLREEPMFRNSSEGRLVEFLRNLKMNASHRAVLSQHLVGLKVQTGTERQERPGALEQMESWRGRPGRWILAGGRRFKVAAISDVSASQLRISTGCSVEEAYYRLGYRMQFPNLPMIKMTDGSLQPIEILFTHVRPQQYKKVLSFFQLERFAEAVRTDPTSYKKQTDAMIDEMGYTRGDPFLDKFGISMNAQMMKCKGRQLDEPTLRNKDQEVVDLEPNRSYLVVPLKDVPHEVCIRVFAMRSPTTQQQPISKDRLGEFFNTLVKCLKEDGVPVGPDSDFESEVQAYSNEPEMRHATEGPAPEKNPTGPPFVCSQGIPTIARAAQLARDRFAANPQNANRSLVLLVVNDRKHNTYGRIKTACDITVGVVSQVVDYRTIELAMKREAEEEMDIYHNLVLKINAKLGGVNITVDEPKSVPDPAGYEPTVKQGCSPVSPFDRVMYIGIHEATHHPSWVEHGLENISFAAMVGSINQEATKYASECWVQLTRSQQVQHFKKELRRLLRKYSEANSFWPKHVIVYRCGLSQPYQPAFIELADMRTVWYEMGACVPTFTFIVVARSQATRFMVPTEGRNAQGDQVLQNPESGTVIDQKVTSPNWFDFWLYGQAGQTGTSRPGHYIVIEDEWRLTPDQLYQITYRLCFLNARCRKPIALPAPSHYARDICVKNREIYKDALASGKVQKARKKATHEELSFLKAEIDALLRVKDSHPGMHFA